MANSNLKVSPINEKTPPANGRKVLARIGHMPAGRTRSCKRKHFTPS